METLSFAWALRNLVAELIMPPGVFLILIVIALFYFKERLRKVTIIFAVAMLWISSTNYFALHLKKVADHFLNFPQPLRVNKINNSLPESQAIVILGGGKRKGALELPSHYQSQDVSTATLERLRFGARLTKDTQLPILLTGGAPDRVSKNDLPEALVMKLVLENEMGVTPKWIEDQSNTTQENAQFSVRILQQEGIQTIYLVTHFWHMPRAKAIYEKAGIKVIEAPMGFYEKQEFTLLDFYPSNEGFQRARWIWHEILGQLWYRLKF